VLPLLKHILDRDRLGLTLCASIFVGIVVTENNKILVGSESKGEGRLNMIFI